MWLSGRCQATPGRGVHLPQLKCMKRLALYIPNYERTLVRKHAVQPDLESERDNGCSHAFAMCLFALWDESHSREGFGVKEFHKHPLTVWSSCI